MAATWYGDDSPHLSLPCQPCFGGSKGCARVASKAGENAQHSGEMGDSSPWTRPSAPERGDTLKALADGRPASELGWGSSSKTAPGVAIDWVTGRTPPHEDGSM